MECLGTTQAGFLTSTSGHRTADPAFGLVLLQLHGALMRHTLPSHTDHTVVTMTMTIRPL